MALTVAEKPSTSARAVRVELGARSYDILIGEGLIAAAGKEISTRFPGARAMVVTDETVAKLHLDTFRASLTDAGVSHDVAVVAAGEGTKNFDVFMELTDKVLAARLERGDLMVALGGGVVGDLTGFVAGTVRRGMKFVQVPTTLLAQVDSSVGGKTGINSSHGKNLIGVFHQPGLVVADSGVLETLDPRDFRAGYGEVVKYGLIDDAAFFEHLERDWKAVFSGGSARIEAVAASCRAKARIVAADEYEGGVRALLNLGHTFGHALEAATGYGARLVHGEGVAIGMAQAFRFSAAHGLCPADDAARVEAHLKAVGLPTRLTDIPGDALASDTLMTHIAQDKKVSRSALTFILARGIGKSFIAEDVDPGDIKTFLDTEQK